MNSTDEYTWEVLPDDYTQYDLSFKLIVIGDSGVGKSCLT
jgi:GTPase SAR1 family protein